MDHQHRSNAVLAGDADRQIVEAVAVEIANRKRLPKPVAGVAGVWKTQVPLVHLESDEGQETTRLAVGDQHETGLREAPRRRDCEVVEPVAVEVSGSDSPAETVKVARRSGETVAAQTQQGDAGAEPGRFAEVNLHRPGLLDSRAEGMARKTDGRVVEPVTVEIADRQRPAQLAVGRGDPRAYRKRDRQLAAAAPRSIAEQVEVSGSMAPVWEPYAADVRRLADEVAQSGSTLVVVVVPHCVQVSPRYRGFYRALGAELPAGDSLARHPSEFVVRLAAALPGVAMVDPLLAMQTAEAHGRQLYRTHDPHLNAEGQLLLAQILASGPLRALAEPKHTSAAGTATNTSVATVAHAAPLAP